MKQEFTQAFTGDRNLFQVLNDLAINGAETGVHLLIAAQITYADDSLLKRLDESCNRAPGQMVRLSPISCSTAQSIYLRGKRGFPTPLRGGFGRA